MLNESILLNLNLEEGVDFKYDDIDEIKSKSYQKRHLKLMGYSEKYSSLINNNMDKWNLHCITNHIITSNKINLAYIKNSYKMDDIFQYAIQNTTIDIEKICPVLFDYLTNKNNK